MSPSAVRLQRVAGSRAGHRRGSGCAHGAGGVTKAATPPPQTCCPKPPSTSRPYSWRVKTERLRKQILRRRSAGKNAVYAGEVGVGARTGASSFAALWRVLMVFHSHLLWVFLCSLIWFSRAKWERKAISCFCSEGSWKEGPPLVWGCWERGDGGGCPEGAQPQHEGLSGCPPTPRRGRVAPISLPTLRGQISFHKNNRRDNRSLSGKRNDPGEKKLSQGKEMIPGKTKTCQSSVCAEMRFGATSSPALRFGWGMQDFSPSKALILPANPPIGQRSVCQRPTQPQCLQTTNLGGGKNPVLYPARSGDAEHS